VYRVILGNAIVGSYALISYRCLRLRLPKFVKSLCADCHGPESLFRYTFFHSPASR